MLQGPLGRAFRFSVIIADDVACSSSLVETDTTFGLEGTIHGKVCRRVGYRYWSGRLQGAALHAPGRRSRGRRVRLHRVPEDPESARGGTGEDDPGRHRPVSVAQRRQRLQGRLGGARSKRLGQVLQAAARGCEVDSRDRQVRSPAADPLRVGRRDLGLPADGWRRGRRVCAWKRKSACSR